MGAQGKYGKRTLYTYTKKCPYETQYYVQSVLSICQSKIQSEKIPEQIKALIAQAQQP